MSNEPVELTLHEVGKQVAAAYQSGLADGKRTDDTTKRLLLMLNAKLDAEPEAPDLDRHVGHHLSIVARTYDDWQRSVDALRLLVGIRLTSDALDKLSDDDA